MTEGPENRGWRSLLTMYSPVSAIASGEPLTVPLQATVRETLEAMDRRGASAVVIADPVSRVALGVFTLRDLVARVMLPGGDLSQPIASVMTSGLITVAPQATAHEAALTMARHGVGRVVLVDGEGKLAGVVSQADLFALQRVGVKEASGRIQSAGDAAGLRQAALAIRRFADGLAAQGVSVETLTQIVSTLNDLLTIRVIDLCADDFDLPGVPFCWVALGSEGRLEQTFATDQDNGIIFEADEAAAPRVQAALLPFAQAVNRMLEVCGFTLCAGKVMAGNAAWCLNAAGWRRKFAGWIEEPQPAALLNATIAFDFRPVQGSAVLADRLWQWLLSAVRERPVFLRQMAENALGSRPPLGTFFGFATERRPGIPRTIDLKARGSRLFVDAARILALSRGVPLTSTAQRLRAAAEQGLCSDEALAALLDAFHFIHLLRLRSQARTHRPDEANRVAPSRLNDLDRHMLREALLQAGKLQGYLAMEFRLRE